DPRVIRFFMLSVHYRHPINFSQELLESAKNSFARIDNAIQNLQHRKNISTNLTADHEQWLVKIKTLQQAFEREMDDDFNTANAIAVMFDLVKEANTYLTSNQTHTEVIDLFLETFQLWLNILGIPEKAAELLDEEIEKRIKQREDARKNRDFQLADQIRDELEAQGIIL